MGKAMLIDTDLCLACNACSVECKRNNQVPVGKDISWTRIEELEIGQIPDLSAYFVKLACNHCTEASCLNNCPTGAISKPDGVHVIIDQDNCISCGTCARECPFGIPHYGEPKGSAQKCRFCYETKSDDEPTACAAACPFGAITFGERDNLVNTGKQRVAYLSERGKTNATLYGENELGGMNVLYVLTDKPSAYGLPEKPVANGSKEPVVTPPVTTPASTPVSEEEDDTSLVPWGVGGAAAVAAVAGVSWVIRRRMSQEKSKDKM